MMPSLFVFYSISFALFLTPTEAGRQRSGPQNLKHLPYVGGDLIGCIGPGLLGLFGRKHWLLAISKDEVLNIVAWGGRISGLAKVHREKREHMYEWEEPDKCYNYGQPYTRAVSDVINDAMACVGETFDYHLLTCNCEHWINKWTTGKGGYSTSSMCNVSKRCHFA